MTIIREINGETYKMKLTTFELEMAYREEEFRKIYQMINNYFDDFKGINIDGFSAIEFNNLSRKIYDEIRSNQDIDEKMFKIVAENCDNFIEPVRIVEDDNKKIKSNSKDYPSQKYYSEDYDEGYEDDYVEEYI